MTDHVLHLVLICQVLHSQLTTAYCHLTISQIAHCSLTETKYNIITLLYRRNNIRNTMAEIELYSYNTSSRRHFRHREVESMQIFIQLKCGRPCFCIAQSFVSNECSIKHTAMDLMRSNLLARSENMDIHKYTYRSTAIRLSNSSPPHNVVFQANFFIRPRFICHKGIFFHVCLWIKWFGIYTHNVRYFDRIHLQRRITHSVSIYH